MHSLRPYQQAAVDKAIAWIKKSIEPCVLELATGAGKSLIVAEIAKWINQNTGKSVLCLQPSKELTKQNHEKYIATGNKASIFSASANSKCTRHPVVFGTPQTVKNHISRFGEKFGAVIIDEAHGITDTIKFIIEQIKTKNKNLRVIGLSATPYRTGDGYIFQYDTDGSFVHDSKDPFFNTCLYRITAGELIEMGFLTQPNADPEHAESYDSENLEINKQGKFDQKSIESVFVGKARKTAAIINDVIRHSIDRHGVMIFAATVQHAIECCESLPQDATRMVDGKTPKKERENIIAAFKAKRIKYLVNVSVLTTGFDAPHVDVIAILRATESPGLLQQIIGRGLRLSPGKRDCLVLDYAKNIERHNLHDNLFRPDIRVKGSEQGSGSVQAVCPECSFENWFTARPNPNNFNLSDDGYFEDLAGNKMEIPAHFGRRCTGQISIPGAGIFERCEYRWTCKICEACGTDNDIAARYCVKCKGELVDPNEKLEIDFQRIKKDPYSVSTDKILSWDAKMTTSQRGNETLVCTYTTEYRTFRVWYNPSGASARAQHEWASLNEAVFGVGHIANSIDLFLKYLPKGNQPKTITSARQKNSTFFTVIAHNRPEDERPN